MYLGGEIWVSDLVQEYARGLRPTSSREQSGLWIHPASGGGGGKSILQTWNLKTALQRGDNYKQA